jgi:thioredoxin 1
MLAALATCPGMKLPHVSEATFDAEVLGSSVPVLVDFTATWCAPCRVLEPILERVATESGGALKVVSVDGDDSSALASRYGVRGFPTVIAFVGGKEVARQIGVANKDKLLAMVPRAAGGANAVTG